MNEHRQIQLLLYDYARRELGDSDRAAVEQHLILCEACAKEVEELHQLLGFLPGMTERPSEKLPDGYWTAFANVVGARVARQAGHPSRRGWVSPVRRLLTGQWKLAAVLGGAAVIAFAAIVFLRSPGPEPSLPAAAAVVPADTSAIRLEKYLRRSKSLLVGVVNMKFPDSGRVDLAVERRTSRELAEESRVLARGSLDPRGRRLVGDLQKIFIELANASDYDTSPTVDLLRSSIERDNLLFKVRMAETAYGNAQFIPVGARR